VNRRSIFPKIFGIHRCCWQSVLPSVSGAFHPKPGSLGPGCWVPIPRNSMAKHRGGATVLGPEGVSTPSIQAGIGGPPHCGGESLHHRRHFPHQPPVHTSGLYKALRMGNIETVPASANRRRVFCRPSSWPGTMWYGSAATPVGVCVSDPLAIQWDQGLLQTEINRRVATPSERFFQGRVSLCRDS